MEKLHYQPIWHGKPLLPIKKKYKLYPKTYWQEAQYIHQVVTAALSMVSFTIIQQVMQENGEWRQQTLKTLKLQTQVSNGQLRVIPLHNYSDGQLFVIPLHN